MGLLEDSRRKIIGMSEIGVNKKDRELCWKYRDLYHACLDKNNNDPQKCLTQLEVRNIISYCNSQMN